MNVWIDRATWPQLVVFGLCFYLVVLAGCSSCEPAQEAPAQPDACESVCVIGSNYCDLDGALTQCKDNGQGCGVPSQGYRCEDEVVGTMCYSGACVPVDQVDVPQLELASEDRASLIEEAIAGHPVDPRVVIIPHEALYAALEGRAFEEAPAQVQQLAVETTAYANDLNTLGVFAEVEEASYFEGDIFLVPMDPVLVPETKSNPFGRPFDGPLQNFRLESSRYYIVAARGLSGYAPWVAKDAQFALGFGGGLPSQGCCGGQPTVSCGFGIPEIGPSLGGGDKPCSGQQDCPFPDALEGYIQTQITVPRFGAEISMIDDPLGVTPKIALRGNGKPQIQLYSLQSRSYYEQRFSAQNLDPNVKKQPLSPFAFPEMLWGSVSEFAVLSCDMCKVVSCGGGDPFGGGTYNPSPEERACLEGKVRGPDTTCYHVDAAVLGSKCAGNSPTLYGAGGSNAGCFHLSNLSSGGGVMLGKMSSRGGFDQTSCGTGLPGYCTMSDGDNPLCNQDPAAAQETAALMGALLGCGQGNTSPMQGMSCCDSGSACVCVGDSQAKFCTSCNGNGNCTNYGQASLFDSRLFEGAQVVGERTVCFTNEDTNAFYCVSKSKLTKEGKDNTTSNGETPEQKESRQNNNDSDFKNKSKEELENAKASDLKENVKTDGAATPSSMPENKKVDEDNKIKEKLVEVEQEEDDSLGKSAKNALKFVVDTAKAAVLALPPDPKQPTKEVATTTDPVVLSTGEFILEYTDLSFMSSSEQFEFRRYYSSQSDDRSELGSNWSHNYNSYIQIFNKSNAPNWAAQYCKDASNLEPTCVVFHNGEGGKVLYIRDPASKVTEGTVLFTPQAGNTSTLYFDGGLWTIRHEDGKRQQFNEFGHLFASYDRFGSGVVVQQEPNPLFRVYLRYCQSANEPELANQIKKEHLRALNRQDHESIDRRLCVILAHAFGDEVRPDWPLEGLDLTTSPIEVPVLPRDASPLRAERLLGIYNDVNNIRYRQHLNEGLFELRNLVSLGKLPVLKTGSRRMRPIFVRDNIGRELKFSYYNVLSAPNKAGLLKSVEGPLGTKVVFFYDQPSGYPADLNEMFLVKVERQDASTGEPSIKPTLVRTREYSYNWPNQTSSGFKSYNTQVSVTAVGNVGVLSGPAYEVVQEIYKHYFSSYLGCSAVASCRNTQGSGGDGSEPDEGSGFFGCTGLGDAQRTGLGKIGNRRPLVSAGATCGLPRFATPPGNPCFEAERQAHQYISEVADNIVRVQRHGRIIESETLYEVNPFDASGDKSSQFDRAIAQRFGGSPRGDFVQTPWASRQSPYDQNGWTSELMPYDISYMSSGPTSTNVSADITDGPSSFLPQVLKARYELEDFPQDTARPLAWDSVQPCFQTLQGCSSVDVRAQSYVPSCDVQSGELLNRDQAFCDPNKQVHLSQSLPGWRPWIRYYDLDEAPAVAGVAKLVRSRVTCEQLAQSQLGQPSHNDILHKVVNRDGVDVYERVTGHRARLEINMRRICQWAKVVDQDGDVSIYGMNYRGQALVFAVEDAQVGGWIVTENIFNADGNVLEERNAQLATEPWSQAQARGYTEYFYDEIDPSGNNDWNDWLPFWWARRGNVLRTRTYPDKTKGVTWAHTWPEALRSFDNPNIRGLEGEPIVYSEVLMSYEPLFNQPQSAQYNLRTSQREVSLQKVQYIFDYQEFDKNSQAFHDALKAFVTWGFRLPKKDNAEYMDILSWMLPIGFYGENINLDKYENGDAIIGFPVFGDDQQVKNLQSIKGTPIAMVVEDGLTQERFTTLIQPAPHGLPRAIFHPTQDATFVQYYRGTDNTLNKTSVLGESSPTNLLDADGLFRGFVAKVTVARYDKDYLASRGPDATLLRPLCDALAGPYQWVLPTGCNGAADARTKLGMLGLPPEIQDELLKAADGEDRAQWNETVLSYSEGGWPKSVWHNGRTSTYERDADGRPLRVVDDVGNVSLVVYDLDNRAIQSSMRDPQGILLSQSYIERDQDGEVVAECVEVKVGGCVSVMQGQKIAFDAPREMEDPAYLLTTYKYSPSGQLYKTMSPTGVVSTRTYNSRGLTISELEETPLDPAQPARQVRYDYDVNGLLVKKRYGTDLTRQLEGALDESYTYDGFYRVRHYQDTRKTNWHYAYDVHGQQVAMKQDAAASSYQAAYVPAQWEVLVHSDAFGRAHLTNLHGLTTSRSGFDAVTGLPLWTEALGASKTWLTYNRQGEVVWSLDEAGNQRLQLSNPHRRSAAQGELPALLGFVASAQIRASSDPAQPYLTTSSWVEFDLQNLPRRATTVGHHGERQVSESSKVNALGHLLKSVNPEGAQTLYERNLLGWPTKMQEQKVLGTSQYDTSFTQYNAWGMPSRITDPKGDVTIKRYNGFGELQEHYMPWSNVSSAYEQYAYDGYARLKQHWLAANQGGSDELKIHYDARGDMTGLEWLNAPSSLPNKMWIEKTYDELGRVTTTTDHNLKAKLLGLQQTSIKEHYVWDSLNRVQTQGVELMGQGRRYDVDSAHLYEPQSKRWQRQVTYPDGLFVARKYDRLGRLESLEHQGQQTQFQWQGDLYKGRTQAWSASADPLVERQQHDGLGRRSSLAYGVVSLNGANQPTSSGWADAYCEGSWRASCAAPLWKAQLKYDVMGRVVSSLRAFGHPTLDLQGQLSTSRRKRWHGYHYNAQGHLVSEWESLNLDEADLVSLPNHLATPVEIDALGQAGQGQQWTWQRESSVGSLVSIHKTAQPTQTRWEHLGNRLPGHQLREVRVDGASYALSHDARGRITSGTRHAFEYDVLGRLVAAKDNVSGQIVESYLYDASGRLVQFVEGTGSSRQTLVHDGDQMVLAYDGQDQAQWRAIWGELQDQLIEFEQGTQRYGVLRDERFSVVGLWSFEEAKLVELGEYDAHGRLTLLNAQEQALCQEEGSGQVCARLDGAMPFAFNTAWRSSLTGLSFMRARWYSPQLGQFVSSDPLEYVDSFNSYAFAAFDPINGWDPWGTKKQDNTTSEGSDDDFDFGQALDKQVLKADELAHRIASMTKKIGDDADEEYKPKSGDSNVERAAKLLGSTAVEIYRVLVPQNGDDLWGEVIMTVATFGLGKVATVLAKTPVGKAAQKVLADAAKASLSKINKIKTKLGRGTGASKGACKGGTCKGKKPCSFGHGTLVKLCDGTSKPIEDVKIGDWVKSKDDETGELSCQRVTQTHTRSASQVYEIVVESEVGQELLLASAEHPFFVEGQQEPKLTQQLLPGDRLVSDDGIALWIRQIRLVPRSQQVFNLTVENKHTYFVGWHGVWNHNEDCDTSFAPTSTPGTFPKANDFSSPKHLKTHWKKHVEKGNEWGSKMTQEQYLARAKKFLSGPRGKDVLEYRRFNGQTVRYNTRTGEYGVVGADGTINTFFRPAMSKRGGDALQYFQEDRMKHIGR